jgi:hypothetical protein
MKEFHFVKPETVNFTYEDVQKSRREEKHYVHSWKKERQIYWSHFETG